MSRIRAGMEIGKYVIECAHSEHPVYFARNKETQEAVVMKRAVPVFAHVANCNFDQLGRVQIENEYRIQSALSHPNICPVTELVAYDQTLFLVAPRVGKSDLTESGSSIQEKLVVLEDVANGLIYCHSQGVVHRDVKEANIVVNRQGRGVLIDFGTAVEIGRKHPILGDIIFRTPGHVAPECVRYEYTPKSDIFSFGVTACQALTGVSLYHIGDIYCDRSRIDPAKMREFNVFGELVMRALSRKPENRPSLEALAGALKELTSKYHPLPSEPLSEPSPVSV